MKKITPKDIEKMSLDEFIERELKYTEEELTKMGYFKDKSKNENKTN